MIIEKFELEELLDHVNYLCISKDSEIRSVAVDILALLPCQKSVQMLEKLTKDPVSTIAEQAKEALEDI